MLDPRIDMNDLVSIWVKMHNIPFEIWSSNIFMVVDNSLFRFVEEDMPYLYYGVMCVARVFVL